MTMKHENYFLGAAGSDSHGTNKLGMDVPVETVFVNVMIRD